MLAHDRQLETGLLQQHEQSPAIMEMTKNASSEANTRSESQALLHPSPFSPDHERHVLEQAFSSSEASQDTRQSNSTLNVIPTAIPITGDTLHESWMPVMAVATPLPYASATGTQQTTTSTQAQSATPNKKESNDDDIIVEPVPSQNSTSHLPTAPTLSNYSSNNPITQQLTTSVQLRHAQIRGKIASDEEKDGIARAQRERDAIQYHTNEAVRAANETAARKVGRYDEGLTVDEGIYTNVSAERVGEGKTGDDEDVLLYGTVGADGKRGYEVSEYDTSKYNTEEYDVTEYKSVYD